MLSADRKRADKGSKLIVLISKGAVFLRLYFFISQNLVFPCDFIDNNIRIKYHIIMIKIMFPTLGIPVILTGAIRTSTPVVKPCLILLILIKLKNRYLHVDFQSDNSNNKKVTLDELALLN